MAVAGARGAIAVGVGLGVGIGVGGGGRAVGSGFAPETVVFAQ